MSNLKEKIIKEIPVFRELGHKFINNEVSSAEFKAMSGGMVLMLNVVEKTL